MGLSEPWVAPLATDKFTTLIRRIRTRFRLSRSCFESASGGSGVLGLPQSECQSSSKFEVIQLEYKASDTLPSSPDPLRPRFPERMSSAAVTPPSPPGRAEAQSPRPECGDPPRWRHHKPRRCLDQRVAEQGFERRLKVPKVCGLAASHALIASVRGRPSVQGELPRAGTDSSTGPSRRD